MRYILFLLASMVGGLLVGFIILGNLLFTATLMYTLISKIVTRIKEAHNVQR